MGELSGMNGTWNMDMDMDREGQRNTERGMDTVKDSERQGRKEKERKKHEPWVRWNHSNTMFSYLFSPVELLPCSQTARARTRVMAYVCAFERAP